MLVLSYDREMGRDSIYFPLDESERVPDIYYTKIRGNPELRPRICLGPAKPNDELTYLARAEERDGKIKPPGASQKAGKRRKLLEQNPEKRKRITTRRLWR